MRVQYILNRKTINEQIIERYYRKPNVIFAITTLVLSFNWWRVFLLLLMAIMSIIHIVKYRFIIVYLLYVT